MSYPASSLKEIIGSTISRLSVLESILSCFEQRYLEFQKHGVTKILDKWCHFSATLGRRVKLRMSNKRLGLVGEAVDIDRDGSLLIRQDSGLVQRVLTGDIIHCKQ